MFVVPLPKVSTVGQCICRCTWVGFLDVIAIYRSNHVCSSDDQGAKVRIGELHYFIYLPWFLGHYDNKQKLSC